ncbi:hypothetical protein D918_03452 [Trichuris suis]|nr:hypothetical protein D918_03452 [Trichuris suis]
MKKEISDKVQNEKKNDYFGSAFLLLDACLCAGIACALIFAPQRIMDALLTERSDGVHWHMARCLGAVFLSQAAVSLLWLCSDDGACRSSVLVSRLQASALCIFACFKVSLGTRGDHTLTVEGLLWIEGLLIVECLLLMCLLFYKKFEIGSTLLTPAQPFYNALSQIDSLLATVVGAVWFAMPDWILHRQVKFPLNDSHIFVSRLFGAYLMATSVYSSRCLYFKTKADRRVWVCGRAAVCAGILMAQLYSQFAYLQWWTENHWFGITLFSMWSAGAFGIFHSEMIENAHNQ